MIHHIPDGKIVGFRYCLKCGLVYVNNAVTRKAIQDGCDPKSIAKRAQYQGGKNGARIRRGR